MSYAHEIGILAIQFVQNYFKDYEDAMYTISYFGHPDYAITILFPIVSSFNTLLAAQLFFTSIITDWANVLLKWIFMDARPYWWVHETTIYGKNIPSIRQAPITCETGPGFPSGHVMCTASTLFVIAYYFSVKKARYRTIIWIVYFCILMAVSLSRMFVAAHFPHQCLAGSIIGYLIGYYVTEERKWCSNWTKTSWKIMLLLSFVMASTSIATYWIMKGFGIDPQWSIKLAFKWCQSPENIHVSSTPIFGLVRSIGSITGLALVSPIMNRVKGAAGMLPTVSIAVTLICCGILRYVEQIIPSHSVLIFYGGQFLVSVMLPVLLLAFVPKLAANKTKRY